ncbi:MAG: dipeptidase [Gammaproteobacteria bacterium]|nr:dipeptidase [Gammaproteobacteria bacterium]
MAKSKIHQFLLACLGAVLLCSAHADESHASNDEFLIVDTHIDTPYRNFRNELNIFDGTNTGQFDLPRAQQGGLSVAFMSIYTPASAAEEGTSKSIALEQIDWVVETADSTDAIDIATCVADVRKLHEEGTLAFALGLENGSPLEGDPANMKAFADLGIRYVTLAHSRSNEFSDSSYDENEPLQGLSDAGRELVHEMNRQGIMIDISHLTDKASWQVLELSKNPVLATHSSLRHFIPGFHRNIPDDLVVAMKENGGVVHINFGSSFVSDESRAWRNTFDDALEEANAASELTPEQRQAFYADYLEANPYPFATVATVADHIDRVVELAGVESIGLGSDFDGVGDTLPIGLKDASMFPNLIDELRERNYDDDALRKILGENLMRVWAANEAIASEQGHEPNCTQP